VPSLVTKPLPEHHGLCRHHRAPTQLFHLRKSSLADAERLGLVPRNAAATERTPASERRDLVTWSSDDLRTCLLAIEDERLARATGCSPPPAWVA
jgi:hypothetical protein